MRDDSNRRSGGAVAAEMDRHPTVLVVEHRHELETGPNASRY